MGNYDLIFDKNIMSYENWTSKIIFFGVKEYFFMNFDLKMDVKLI